jgi:uncharacterized SAM-binding protein YcdF (DUF218 family)
MLAWIMEVGAVLCLAYFIMIVLYAGIGTGSIWIWLMFAAFLGVSAFCTHQCQKYPERIPLRLPVSLITLCAAGIMIMLVLQILIFGSVPGTAEPDLDYVIVLGAKTHPDGSISRTLKLRLDKAAEYVAQNPRTVLVLSGGQMTNETAPEAQIMKNYLLEKGVPELQMVLEQQSKSTAENIAYSRLMIAELRSAERIDNEKKHPHAEYSQKLPEALRKMEFRNPDREEDSGLERPLHIGIVTSNFHLFRAMQIAKKQNLYHVTGIAAPSDPVLLIHMAFRDGLAILKDRLAGNL